jgi:histone acetyltransferase MYST1
MLTWLVDKRLDEWVGTDRFVSHTQLEVMKREGRFPPHLSASLDERPARRNPNRTPTIVDPAYEQLEREHEEATKVKNIQRIVLGRFEIDCWYFSPYPDEYAQHVDRMFICEKCLKYMKGKDIYESHYHRCEYNGPPGKLIYLKEGLAVFELSGDGMAKLYCQNLCLLAKLFLDHKTLYYDVSPFWFYVLCEVDAEGVHPVGYFSKEKSSQDDYNLACIMILPPYQKRGYGRFLIQLSYEITRREGKAGSPEKPLSDLGRLSYHSFWSYELLMRLRNGTRAVPSIAQLSQQTAFKQGDIIDTLTELGLLRQYRGQKILNLAPKALDTLFKPFEGKKFTILDPECLDWP